jgi:hypothetical protein
LATQQRSPGAWLTFLEPRLDVQSQSINIYRRYYAGVHRLSYATAKFKEAFARFFPPIADNWMQIVVDAPVERLRIIGFRYGGDAGVDDVAPIDEDARKTWQRNNLDLVSRQVHTEAIKCGVAYLLVDPTPDEGPRITGEHAHQVYVHVDPESGERLAAIKRWVGDDEFTYANIYMPDGIVKFRSKEKVRNSGLGAASYTRIDAGVNDLQVVPMIPVMNSPDMLHGGTSDLEVAIPIQDRINKLCLDLDVGSEFTAAPQRYASGWDPPRDPQTGQPLKKAQQAAAVSRMLAFPEVDTKVGSLPSGDPAAWVTPIEMYVKHLGAVSRTPPHYLLGQLANVSGDGMKMAETGLVSKSTAKQDDFADPWEETVSLSIGKDPENCEVLWGDPESRTFSQMVDAVVKVRDSLEIPLEVAWEMVGLTPQQINRIRRLLKVKPGQSVDEVVQARKQAEQQAQFDRQQQMVDARRQTSQTGGGATPPGQPQQNGRKRDAPVPTP